MSRKFVNIIYVYIDNIMHMQALGTERFVCVVCERVCNAL